MSIFKKMKLAYKDTKKSVLVVYLLLRFLVILVLIRQIFLKNYDNVFLCFFTLILFLLPFVLSKKLNIELPSLLEIIILLFIYSAEVLGEIQNFYNTFSHWDTILHTMKDLIVNFVGAVAFSIIGYLYIKNRDKYKFTENFILKRKDLHAENN